MASGLHFQNFITYTINSIATTFRILQANKVDIHDGRIELYRLIYFAKLYNKLYFVLLCNLRPILQRTLQNSTRKTEYLTASISTHLERRVELPADNYSHGRFLYGRDTGRQYSVFNCWQLQFTKHQRSQIYHMLVAAASISLEKKLPNGPLHKGLVPI